MVPDPAGQAAVNIADPQSWNRYAYVANRPLNSIDPLGLIDCVADDNGNLVCNHSEPMAERAQMVEQDLLHQVGEADQTAP
jgi:uncharacterized protein RhaS with RHS repeats